MTIKQKLYKEYVIAKNKLNALRGEELIGGDNIVEYFNSDTFRYIANDYTKDDIKRMIDNVNISYNAEVEKLRIENYFSTEEGRIEKENLTNQYEKAINERRELVISVTNEVDSFIKDWLGKDWGCGMVGNSQINIGIVDTIDENNINHLRFGHSFSLYYNDYFAKDDFKMNYGCMSSFSLLKDNDEDVLRCLFLSGMGKFVSDKEKVNELCGILKEFCLKEEKHRKLLDILEYNLTHPFNKKEIV